MSASSRALRSAAIRQHTVLCATPSQTAHTVRRHFSNHARHQSSTATQSPRATWTYTAAVVVAATATATLLLQNRQPHKLDKLSLAEADAKLRYESGVNDKSPMRLRMEKFIREQQVEIVRGLQDLETSPTATFRRDEWQRPEGGGGVTCVLQDGETFEKAGVGISVVYGTLPKAAVMKMKANHANIVPEGGEIPDQLEFFASGISLVVHPRNPMAPTVHLNYRYFETGGGGGEAGEGGSGAGGAWWFGGGSDLTPSYLFDEDTILFHKNLKDVCDKHNKDFHPKFKKWCDEYFFNKHRGECRGVGGIFFDDLDETTMDKENLFAFVKDGLKTFLPTYTPIVQRRMDSPFTAQEKEWQQVRRGKYVEFNLVHDRGTAFGLNTPGSRVESILMSLPLTATWKYMFEPQPKSRELRLVEVLREPKDWV